MIDQLDILLRKLITTTVPGFTSDDQVRFQPPDDDWRTYVKTLNVAGNPANALNIYLTDLRENRKLRSNDRIQAMQQNGDVRETPAPHRVDCHYLISAWSPADVTPAIEPTIDEHAVLYAVARTLTLSDPLTPTTIYAPGPVPATFPPELADAQLPIATVPPEGFIKLAEFWGTMGDKHRWKPVVYLIITLPIQPGDYPVGPAVTTAITHTLTTGVPATTEEQIEIGGTVYNTATPAQPLANVWVELLDSTGTKRLQLATTDASGRFVFVRVAAGSYQLRASATGYPVTVRPNVTVPSTTGEYDLQL